jgi:uncharacterized membrane protein
MKAKIGILGVFTALLIGLMAMSAAAIPVEVDWVKIDGDIVYDGDVLDVDRDSGIDIKVQFEPLVDVDNMYVEAFISGHEYGILRDDSVEIKDLDAGNTYKTKLFLDLPQNMDKDEYSLRILMSDRSGVLSSWSYDLDVGSARHGLLIKDVIFEPENAVKAGWVLEANARIKNIGEKDETGIKVEMSIPELGLSDSEYIDELEAEDSVTSESMAIRIDACTEPGEYDVIVKAYFEEPDEYDPAVYEDTIVVVDSDVCGGVGEEVSVRGTSVIEIGPTSQDIARGTGASFPVTIENTGSTTKEYTVSVEGTEGFAVAQVTPSATVTLQPGESETVYAYLVVDKDAPLGEHVATISVRSGDELLQRVNVKANVVKEKGSSLLVKVLEIGLIALIVLLVILLLVFGFNKLKDNKEDEEDEDIEQTYY